jgi:hypothetical protein
VKHAADAEDPIEVKKKLWRQSSLPPAETVKAKTHVTVARAPTFRSDERVLDHKMHHDEIRQQHDAKGQDLVELKVELRKQTTLDRKTIEANHSHITSGAAPTFRSDKRIEEWGEKIHIIRANADAKDLSAVRLHLKHQSSLTDEEFGLPCDVTGSAFDCPGPVPPTRTSTFLGGRGRDPDLWGKNNIENWEVGHSSSLPVEKEGGLISLKRASILGGRSGHVANLWGKSNIESWELGHDGLPSPERATSPISPKARASVLGGYGRAPNL